MTTVIDSDAIRERVSARECIDILAGAMLALRRGEASAPARSKLPLADNGDMLMTMPGALQAEGIAGVKALTLRSSGDGPSVQGLITLFDLETGAPLAALDAAAITELRTAAASALATKYLARDDARVLAVLGTGVQAQSHIEAMQGVRAFDRVLIWGRSADKAEAVACWVEAHLDVEARAEASAERCVSQADIVCTVTSSPAPVMKGEWLRLGTHINMVGAHTPSTREVDTETIKRSRLIVETRTAALQEAGEVLIPLNARDIGEDRILGELAEVILGYVKGRLRAEDITAYKSLGNIAQDLAVAHHVVQQVRKDADQFIE